MTLVAVALIGRQRPRSRPRQAVVLPLVETTDNRNNVLVAEVLQRLGRESRTHTTGAVDRDVRGLVGEATFNGEFELTTRYVDGVGDGTLVVLVRFTDVENREVIELCRNGRGFDFTNLGLGGVE